MYINAYNFVVFLDVNIRVFSFFFYRVVVRRYLTVVGVRTRTFSTTNIIMHDTIKTHSVDLTNFLFQKKKNLSSRPIKSIRRWYTFYGV